MGQKRTRTWKDNNEAVSEVVGSALLVGLTVAVVSAFGLVATQAFSPTEKINADLSPLLSPGPDAVWGTSDDGLTLTHLGGADLPRASTRIVITEGAAVTTLAGPALGAVFDDGGLVIGETWKHTAAFATCSNVQVAVVIDHGRGGSQLLLQETLVANEGACP